MGDTAGKPLPDVEIVALRARRIVKTDRRDTVVVPLPPGEETFIIRRIGNFPQSFDATLVAGDSTRMGVNLAASPVAVTTLPDLVVEAEGVSYGGRMAGFGTRLRSGAVPRSNFLTRKDLEASGLTLPSTTSNGPDSSSWSTGEASTCSSVLAESARPGPRFRVSRCSFDAIHMNAEFDIKSLDLSQLEAIEVSRSAAQLLRIQRRRYRAHGAAVASGSELA